MHIRHLQRALDAPRLLSSTSAWIEHIPFAMALVDWLRPRSIVELGVHAGDSYCAFCQAALTLKLRAQCTGIDTWQGDPHAGLYGAEVLQTLRTHHDPLYAHFSRLLPSTFDAAAASFAPASVDLLHIDGLHTYAAVRHDADTWLPKLSPTGVLLLHDTQVREKDFGVHQLWQEIAPHFPSFEFHHGHGLGILAMPKALTASPALSDFFAWTRQNPDDVRATFAALGKRTSDLRHARHPLKPVTLTLFTSDAKGGYHSDRVQTREVLPDGSPQKIAFALSPGKKRRHRLDPGDHPALWLLETITLNPPAPAPTLRALGAISVHPSKHAGILLRAAAEDPQLELILRKPLTTAATLHLELRTWPPIS